MTDFIKGDLVRHEEHGVGRVLDHPCAPGH